MGLACVIMNSAARIASLVRKACTGQRALAHATAIATVQAMAPVRVLMEHADASLDGWDLVVLLKT